MAEYRTVSLPVSLLDRIDRFLEDRPGMGYTNRSQFIKEAVRRLLDRLGDGKELEEE